MMAMMKNTSNIDRAIRLMIGILLLIVAFAVDAVANNMVLKVIVFDDEPDQRADRFLSCLFRSRPVDPEN